jgi:hypothetical protein
VSTVIFQTKTSKSNKSKIVIYSIGGVHYFVSQYQAKKLPPLPGHES